MNTTQQTTDHLQAVLADLADVLDRITPDQATDPTPCAEWDVATARHHTLGWLTAFTDGYAAENGLCSDPDAVTVEGTGADQVRACSARLAEVLPAAADGQLFIGEAGMPGGMALSMILWEYQMHGWDLAAATGQPWSPGAAGVEESLAFAPGMLTADFQGEGMSFGPRVEVGPDAPAFDRLLGLSGRDPQWRRPA